MNASPTIQQAQPTPHVDSAAALFFKLIYGSISGWIELSAIEGDPDDRTNCRFHQGWFCYNPNRLDELLNRASELVQRYGNVYCSVNVYTRPRRDAPIKPGRVVFVDDLPEEHDASFSVQTSPSKRHGYYLLNQDTSIEARRELARRAAYALGGDRSGWDPQQLARIPGGYNTKAKIGGHYLVTLQIGNRKHYDPQELRASWPEVIAPASGELGTLDWPDVERWLGNLDTLIGANSLPRRVKPNTQTGRTILAGGLADRSLARYIVARGLILHGYPDDEIAALLWHYCEYGHTDEKGSAWLQADIARIITKERAKLPGIAPSPTHAGRLQPAQSLPEIAPPKRGRKTVLTSAQLLAFYEREMGASDVVLLTVSEVAQRLGVSRATVERCEQVLRAEGAIERRPFNRRQSSLVAILRPLKIDQPAADQAPDHVPSNETPILIGKPETSLGSVHEGTHPPEGSGEGATALGPAAALNINVTVVTPRPRSADEWIYEAIVSIDTLQPVDVVNRKTGEVRAIKLRVSKKRVEKELAARGIFIVPEVLDKLYPEQLERRTRERKIAALAELRPAGLRAQIRLAEHMADKSKAQETNEYRWWLFYRDMARRELASRPPEPGRPKGGRKVCEALPDVRATAAQYQHRMLDEVEAQREDWRARAPRGVCSSQPRSSVVQASAPQPNKTEQPPAGWTAGEWQARQRLIAAELERARG